MKRLISITVVLGNPASFRSRALRNGKIRSRGRKLPDRVYLRGANLFPSGKVNPLFG
jgi:hypothetical protein